MVKWLINNREWLFSGVGIAAIAGLIALVRRIMRSRDKNSVLVSAQPAFTPMLPVKSENPFDFREYARRPFPNEIASDIKATPPYQRQAKAASYTGLKIQWLTALEHLRDPGKGTAHLMLLDRGHYPWIYCDVALDKYPQLKILKSGARIRIFGKIATAEQGQFSIAVDHMIFTDEA